MIEFHRYPALSHQGHQLEDPSSYAAVEGQGIRTFGSVSFREFGSIRSKFMGALEGKEGEGG